MVTSNLPFDEWTSVFASERLTGALLDRLTHYRLKQSKRRARDAVAEAQPADIPQA
jgi:DNA replication protein DnaC